MASTDREPANEGPNSSPSKEAVEEFCSLIQETTSRADQVSTLLESFNDKIAPCSKSSEDVVIDDGKITTEHGLGFLELKNLTMLEYLSNLAYIMLRKTCGKKIEGEKAIERIVENRTVLEKMRPIEKKLRYQIDKYVKVADAGGEIRPEDPVHFKPNPLALAAQGDDTDDESVDESADESKVKGGSSLDRKYVVPKHIPTLYENETTAEKSRQDMEKEAAVKKRTLSKSILEDLRRQHLDTPEEVHNQMDTLKAKHVALIKERTRFEEDNFMRLPAMSKKEKHKLRKRSMTTMGNLADEVTYFGRDNFFNAQGDSKRRKSDGSKGGGKSSNKKKKFKR